MGELIHKMLEQPGMEQVRARQIENGRIADIDKPLIIDMVKNSLSTKIISQFNQTVDNWYVKVKMDLLPGKGEKAFEQYLMYNTNISSTEVFRKEKSHLSEEDFDDFINELKNKTDPNEMFKFFMNGMKSRNK